MVSVNTVVRFRCQMRLSLSVKVYLQGLEGGAMGCVWLPWLLVIQTENWSATYLFSDLLLMLSAIRR